VRRAQVRLDHVHEVRVGHAHLVGPVFVAAVLGHHEPGVAVTGERPARLAFPLGLGGFGLVVLLLAARDRGLLPSEASSGASISTTASETERRMSSEKSRSTLLITTSRWAFRFPIASSKSSGMVITAHTH